jgi:hypothetical protein
MLVGNSKLILREYLWGRCQTISNQPLCHVINALQSKYTVSVKKINSSTHFSDLQLTSVSVCIC